MSIRFSSVFGKGYVPLFRLTNGGKVSHLFGSCHVVPLNDLSLTNSISKILNPKKEDECIIDLLKGHKTLITEPGNIFTKDKYTLDSCQSERDNIINTLKNSDKLVKYNGIINEPDFYKRFIKLHEVIEKDKPYKRGTYLPSLLNVLKGDKIYQSLNEISKSTLGISVSRIKLMDVAKAMYTTMIISGIDCSLMHHYASNGLPVYGLDPLVSNKLSNYTDRYLTRSIRLLTFISIILSKIQKTYIVDTIKTIHRQTVDDYLFKSWDSKNPMHNGYIVTERNNQWIPHILRYHNETDDPLFVVGAGHLNGNSGLINLLTQKQFHIDVFDLSRRSFVPLKN